MVQDWVNQPSANYGAAWTPGSGDPMQAHAFASEAGYNLAPKLTVTYFTDSTQPIVDTVTDDGEYTTVNTQLHASWTCSDEESGIKEYKYAVGTTAGAIDVKDWTSTGVATWPDSSPWTSAAPTFDPPLDDGTYYFAVKAWNWAGLPSAQGNSDGITVDTVAPSFSNIAARPGWVERDTDVAVTFTASEALSADPTVTVNGRATTFLYKLDGNEYTYLYTVTDLDSTGPATIAISGTDLAGNPGSAPPNTTALHVYWVEAGAPTVTDDGEQTVDTALHATWEPPSAEFAAAEYQYAVGTAPGATDVQYWTTAGTATEVTTDALPLVLDTTYFVSVKAQEEQGVWSAVGTTNGIKYVAFMLEVDYPTPVTVLASDYTLPTVWEDGSKTHDVRGRVGVIQGGALSGVTLTVNGLPAEVTLLDERHGTWTNINTTTPVTLQEADWTAISVAAALPPEHWVVRTPVGTASADGIVDTDEVYDHVRYIQDGGYFGFFTTGGPEGGPPEAVVARYVKIIYQSLQPPRGIVPERCVVGIVQNLVDDSGKFDYSMRSPPLPAQVLYEMFPAVRPRKDGKAVEGTWFDSKDASSLNVFSPLQPEAHKRGDPGGACWLKYQDSPSTAPWGRLPYRVGDSQFGVQCIGNIDSSGVGTTALVEGVHKRFYDWLVLAIDSNTTDDNGEDQREWQWYKLRSLKMWRVEFIGTGVLPAEPPPPPAPVPWPTWTGAWCRQVAQGSLSPGGPKTSGRSTEEAVGYTWKPSWPSWAPKPPEP